MPFVYQAVFQNGAIYVGQTTGTLAGLRARYKAYTNSRRPTKRPSEVACRLYGTPKLYILEECAPDELDARELYWICHFESPLNVRGWPNIEISAAYKSMYEYVELAEHRLEGRLAKALCDAIAEAQKEILGKKK